MTVNRISPFFSDAKLFNFVVCALASQQAMVSFGAEGSRDQVSLLTQAASDSRVSIDTIWVLISAMLIFFMNAGFAMVESGLCRSKNCVNILAKNLIVFAAATISFWGIGWGLMFGNGNSTFGIDGMFFVSGSDNSPALGTNYVSLNSFSTNVYKGDYTAISWTPVPLWAKFFFQLVFAGTAATIVSGAVAERIKFKAFLIFSFCLVAFVYPISGHWIWGGGILNQVGFRDFAGSTVVHSVGGWAAVTGVMILGPRLGKYEKSGKIHPILGHSMTSATLGVFILWLGWFGFNPGSTMSAANPAAISHIIVATNISAAFGALAATLASWIFLKKPELSMILNGSLAGLVAITAPCAFVTIGNAALIGIIAGFLVVASILLLDFWRLDDPVGALSVHLVNGVWGTMALGVFYDNHVATAIAGSPTNLTRGGQIFKQFIGVVSVGAFAFVASLIIWLFVRWLIGGIRVSRDEEIDGLDFGEHGDFAYPDFQGK